MRSGSRVRTSPSLASVAVAILLVAGLHAIPGVGIRAQSSKSVVGEWKTLPDSMPINPVHVALLRTGKVLVVSGSGNVAGNTNLQAGVWDPDSGSIMTQPVTWDMFCNGMVILPDGRPLINGGTIQYDPFYGQPRNARFDPLTNTFTDVQSMAHGRRYPTVTTLGDGRVMTFSGLKETGGTNTAVEIFDARRRMESGTARPAGRLRCIHACICCRTAECSIQGPGPDRASSIPLLMRGPGLSPRPITLALGPTGFLCCCR